MQMVAVARLGESDVGHVVLNGDEGRLLILIRRFSDVAGLGVRYNALVILIAPLMY